MVWLLAGLAAYGSLFPFRFAAPELTGRHWAGFWSDGRVWTSTGDVAGNVLLFAPLGVALAWALTQRKAGKGAWVTHGLLGVLFALVLQAAQMFLPARDPALSDVLWNTLGLAAGMALGGVLQGARLRSHARGADVSHGALYLLAAWVAVELAPLVPTVDWQNIKDALKPLLRLEWSTVKGLHAMAFALVCASLLSMVGGPRRASARWVQLFLLLAMVTLMRPFIAGKTVTPGWLAGLGVGLAVAAAAARAGPARLAQASLAALWIAIVANGLAPFQLRSPPAPMDWVPFRSMLSGSMEANFWSLVATVVVSAVWLGLSVPARVPWRPAMLVLLVTVAAVEWLQMHVQGRTPDVTPVLLAGMVGLALAKWFDRADSGRHRSVGRR